jgi:hypothetical protein
MPISTELIVMTEGNDGPANHANGSRFAEIAFAALK